MSAFFISNLLGDENPVKLREVIESIGDKINKAVVAGDYDTIMSYHTDDVIIMPDFKPMVKGKKAWKEEIKKDRQRGAKVRSFSGTIMDLWSCENQVYERGTFGMSVTSNESTHPIALYGSYFQIWEKQTDGSYKIKFTIWNLDFNPFEK